MLRFIKLCLGPEEICFERAGVPLLAALDFAVGWREEAPDQAVVEEGGGGFEVGREVLGVGF